MPLWLQLSPSTATEASAYIRTVLQSARELHSAGRVLARERSDGCVLESIVHANNRCVEAKTGRAQGRESVEAIKGVESELLLVTSDPAFEAAIQTLHFTSDRIKLFFGKHGILLDVVANNQHRWERKGELQDARRSNERGQIADLGNCSRHNERSTPVNGNYRRALVSKPSGRAKR